MLPTIDRWQRTWKKEEETCRIGVDVRPEGRIVIDVYNYLPPKADYFLGFTFSEWDALCEAVTARRREMETARAIRGTGSHYPPD